MTVRSWLMIGLVLQGCLALLASFQQGTYASEHWSRFRLEWLWVGALCRPAMALFLITFRSEIAGWILGPDADKPAPLGTWELATVGTALLGSHAIVSGCGHLEGTVVGWASYGTPTRLPEIVSANGGLFGLYLREVWLAQFVGFLAVIAARTMPRIMRLPRDPVPGREASND